MIQNTQPPTNPQPEQSKLHKSKKSHCTFCQRELNYIRVFGSEASKDPLYSNFAFDVSINKGRASASLASTLDRDAFESTSNPRKFLAELEVWIEDEAQEAHCPYCLRVVQIPRVIIPPTPINAPSSGPSGGNQGLNALLQQLQNSAGGNQNNSLFQMGTNSPTFGQNRASIQALFDAKFTDQELLDILADLDSIPPAGTTHGDLVTILLDYLYQI